MSIVYLILEGACCILLAAAVARASLGESRVGALLKLPSAGTEDNEYRYEDVMTQSKGLQIAAVLAACILLSTGCVERKLTINTEPQGALVTLNDEEIGISPVTVGFEWYGDYKVRAAKEGYEILNTHRKLDRPGHDVFPLDFFAEVLWPRRIKDSYEWTFELTPYTPPDRDQLIHDAQKFRQEALQTQ